MRWRLPELMTCATCSWHSAQALIVRDYLEPGDVETIQVPRFEEKEENTIADLVEEVARLRADADDLEDKVTDRADKMVELFLHGEVNSTEY